MKSNKYIQENLDYISNAHNSLIQGNYFYNVGMTFNNNFKIHNAGLNPIKRGKPKVNIDFQKNSCLFDESKVNPNWMSQDQEKWAK